MNNRGHCSSNSDQDGPTKRCGRTKGAERTRPRQMKIKQTMQQARLRPHQTKIKPRDPTVNKNIQPPSRMSTGVRLRRGQNNSDEGGPTTRCGRTKSAKRTGNPHPSEKPKQSCRIEYPNQPASRHGHALPVARAKKLQEIRIDKKHTTNDKGC